MKGQVKISTFIVALLVGSLVMVFFSLFLSSLNSKYNLSYDNSTLSSYNKLNSLVNQTSRIQNQTAALNERSGLLDILGSYFSQGYQALKISISSLDIFIDITNHGMEDLNLGPSGLYLKAAIIAIVIILLIIGVLISSVVKNNL